VRTVWVASPRPHPIVLAAAHVAGVDGLLAAGGAQVTCSLPSHPLLLPPSRPSCPSHLSLSNCIRASHTLMHVSHQAIAAFTYGAGAVPVCDAIVGPGNKFVTAAKSLVRFGPKPSLSLYFM
jgi:phosphoribosyl-ATP pyrophosphohydrolase/phosphoribosyl-AMP cyclohydrolase/histidinol dehydrogenase